MARVVGFQEAAELLEDEGVVAAGRAEGHQAQGHEDQRDNQEAEDESEQDHEAACLAAGRVVGLEPEVRADAVEVRLREADGFLGLLHLVPRLEAASDVVPVPPDGQGLAACLRVRPAVLRVFKAGHLLDN